MKFDIPNRFTGAVQFTAEIDCSEDAPLSIKVGLAVEWAMKSGANLSRADLSRADLREANLSGAKEIPALAAAQTLIVPAGNIIGWKKCRRDVIVRLSVPTEARRSNATGRKCRAEFVDVIEVIGAEVGVSTHDGKTEYRVGQRVTCDAWCEDRWQECAGGVHFFLTEEEASAY